MSARVSKKGQETPIRLMVNALDMELIPYSAHSDARRTKAVTDDRRVLLSLHTQS